MFAGSLVDVDVKKKSCETSVVNNHDGRSQWFMFSWSHSKCGVVRSRLITEPTCRGGVKVPNLQCYFTVVALILAYQFSITLAMSLHRMP